MVTVTSAANHARLEEIRRANARLADPRGLSDDEAERLVREGKVVVAMAYSIHSTEVGGTLTALRLAAPPRRERRARGARLMLDAVVLLVLPSHNPDGTDIVARLVPPAARHALRGHGAARALPPLRRPRQQPRLVHVHAGGDPAHGRPPLPALAPADRARRAPDGLARRAALRAPLHRPLGAERRPRARRGRERARLATWRRGSSTAGRTRHRDRRALRRLDARPAPTPHTHGGVRILSETASARLADAARAAGARSSRPRGASYDPRRPLRQLPRALAGRDAGGSRDIVETQLRASLAVLEHAAHNREHWLRTALAVNRRAVARREPFAFVLPGRASATPRRSRGSSRCCAPARSSSRGPKRPSRAGSRRYATGAIVVRLQQPASALREDAARAAGLPGPARVRGRAAQAALRRDRAHAAAAAGRRGRRRRGALRRAELEPLADGARDGRDASRARGPRFALGHTSGDLVALARLLARRRPRCAGRSRRSTRAAAATRRARCSCPPPAGARSSATAAELGIVARSVARRASQPRAADAARRPLPLLGPVDGRGLDALRVREGDGRPVPDARTTRTCARAACASASTRSCCPTSRPRRMRDGHAEGTMPEEYTGGLGEAGAAALRAFVEAGGTLVALDTAAAYAIELFGLPLKNALAGLDSKTFFCPGSILRASVDATLAARPRAAGAPAGLVRGARRHSRTPARHGRRALRRGGPAAVGLPARRRAPARQGGARRGAASAGARSCSSASARSTARRAASPTPRS